MLLRVQVEHEIGQRPLQFRAQSEVHRKACAGDLRGALEIENAELRTEVPMGLRSEVELRRRAPLRHFEIVVRRCADGDRGVGQIRDAGEHQFELVVDALNLFIQKGNPLTHGAHFGLQSGGVRAGLFLHSDGLRFGVAAALQLLDFRERGAAAGVGGAKSIQVERETAIGETRRGGLQVGSELIQVMHRSAFLSSCSTATGAGRETPRRRPRESPL